MSRVRYEQRPTARLISVTVNRSGAGSFGLAVLLTVVMHRRVPAHFAAAVSIGFFGAYTTFSTFAWETFDLSRTNRQPLAVTYVVVSIVGAIAAAWLGHIGTRAIVAKG